MRYKKLKYEPWHYDGIENSKMFEYVYKKYVKKYEQYYIYILTKPEITDINNMKVGKCYLTPSNYYATLLEIKGDYYIFLI